MFFFLILFGFLLFDALWWLFADRLARRTSHPRLWRRVAGLFAGSMIGGIFLLLGARLLQLRVMVMPEMAVMAVFIWHFIVMPAVLIPTLIVVLFRLKKPKPPVTEVQAETEVLAKAGMSRRDFLSGAIVAVPPVATFALTGRSRWTEDDLIRRDIDLPIPNLPPALEGLTIAHVSDPHLGSFIREAKFKKIISTVNEMDADLVLQTGDLINSSLGDLPDGIDMLRQFRGRYGVFSCQGNHDCIMDRELFTSQVKKADLNLLVDEANDLRINGTRLRLIGLPWVGYEDKYMAWRANQLLGMTSGEVFPILLAHHPHAFDAAAAAGIPLTLSGHTHGGQIALNKNIGFGPLMYRYWSGAYRNNNSTCFVSNGTGNWFPLRINVPCEVLRLTLRRA